MKNLLTTTVICMVVTSSGAQAFIAGHNICGINTAAWRKAHQLSVPPGPALAASWLSLPRHGKHAGSVMVVKRPHGGYHVAIVLPNGQCHDPSSRHQGWRDMDCNSIWRGQWRTFVG